MFWKFNDRIMFSKLINLMASLSSIEFYECDFMFTEDWKINKSNRYVWDNIDINGWKFAESSFMWLIKIITQIVKYKKISLDIQYADITTEDANFEKVLDMLDIEFSKNRKGSIAIDDSYMNRKRLSVVSYKLKRIMMTTTKI